MRGESCTACNENYRLRHKSTPRVMDIQKIMANTGSRRTTKGTTSTSLQQINRITIAWIRNTWVKALTETPIRIRGLDIGLSKEWAKP